eukprot:TRINITY_DN4529_c0_g2_i1.p1 TRINITY_DN4529_c0_g2~~TRINITY_DN4529_c0_g2_i1.p1  ORF type:complete len:520 (+),score=103.68 TRINITY_DN4529_c0_g2_i1:88-1647(+)
MKKLLAGLLNLTNQVVKIKLAFLLLKLMGFPVAIVEEITFCDFSEMLGHSFFHHEDLEEISGLAGVASLMDLESLFSQGVNLNEETVHCISEMLKSLVLTGHTSFKLAFLFWQTLLDPSAGFKQAKNMIKSDQNNLLLYRCFARLKYLASDIDSSKKVYISTLFLSGSFSTPENASHFLLACLDFVIMEVRRSNDLIADAPRTLLLLARILLKEDIDVLSTSVLLKLRANHVSLRDSLQALFSSGQNSSVETCTTDIVFLGPPDQAGLFFLHCFVIYFQSILEDPLSAPEQYIDSVGVLLNCMHCFDSGSGSRTHYWVVRNSVHLLYKHVSFFKNAFPLYRSFLEKCCSVFVGDSFLLCHLVEADRHLLNRYNLRKFFDQHLRKDNTLSNRASSITWLHYLAAEYFSGHADYGKESRLRRLFERCLNESNSAVLSQSSTSRSIVLWRFYLKFEIQNGLVENAKRVFYRAITACPSSKKLWLDGLHSLMDHFRLSEIIELLELMIENGMTFRFKLDFAFP